ncbi:DNA repair protein RecO [Candidatus Chlamydia sanziniae]|uniref:DNA repair protein RecO n=1 Tax=Candidatus Chlamydia sanziniae TaxID=1806891 RepID=A0A1A9HTR6_9CHLA|nr:DNA recombination and repair protein RecO [Candidatus Chlamydia sanziniae]
MPIVVSGVVLESQPLGKNHLRTTLFSPGGLITFFAKHGQTLLCSHREALIPVSLGSYTLNSSPTKLRSLAHAEIRNNFIEIKRAYPLLEASGKMIRALLISQWREKPSPKLFSLFLNFLHRLPQSKNPRFFSAIFILKLLQHEGILDLSPTCSLCKKNLSNGPCYRYQGQKLCKNHAHTEAIVMEKEEEQVLHAIVHAKQFYELLKLTDFPIAIADKIFYMLKTTLHSETVSKFT